MNQVKLDRQAGGAEVAIQAYKNLLNTYAMRTRQAEAATGVLMGEKLGAELTDALVNKLSEQMTERGIQLSDQYEGLIQTTLMALNHIARTTTDAQTKTDLAQIIQGLTMAVQEVPWSHAAGS